MRCHRDAFGIFLRRHPELAPKAFRAAEESYACDDSNALEYVSRFELRRLEERKAS
jgi:hypothetical protein